MSKGTQAVDAQPEKRNGHKPKTAVLPERPREFATVTELPGGLLGANGNAEALVTRLDDARFLTIQRQAMAAQIGQVQGNRHLQRTMDFYRTCLNTPVLIQRQEHDTSAAGMTSPEGMSVIAPSPTTESQLQGDEIPGFSEPNRHFSEADRERFRGFLVERDADIRANFALFISAQREAIFWLIAHLGPELFSDVGMPVWGDILSTAVSTGLGFIPGPWGHIIGAVVDLGIVILGEVMESHDLETRRRFVEHALSNPEGSSDSRMRQIALELASMVNAYGTWLDTAAIENLYLFRLPPAFPQPAVNSVRASVAAEWLSHVSSVQESDEGEGNLVSTAEGLNEDVIREAEQVADIGSETPLLGQALAISRIRQLGLEPMTESLADIVPYFEASRASTPPEVSIIECRIVDETSFTRTSAQAAVMAGFEAPPMAEDAGVSRPPFTSHQVSSTVRVRIEWGRPRGVQHGSYLPLRVEAIGP